MGWTLAVHIGAGRYGEGRHEAPYLALLRESLLHGQRLLEEAVARGNQPTATTPAVAVVTSVLGVLERHPLTNCGHGSNLTEQGVVECEASVVCGATGLVGACANLRGVAEPSALAHGLLEQAGTAVVTTEPEPSNHILGREPPLVVVGEHARELAARMGLGTSSSETESFQVTSSAKKQWQKWHALAQMTDGDAYSSVAEDDHTVASESAAPSTCYHGDTVGAVCMDAKGNMAAALSSGGILYKVPGRVGIAGCPRMGCDARNPRLARDTRPAARGSSRKSSRGHRVNRATVLQPGYAVACTGRGEHFIRSNLVNTLGHALRDGSCDVDHTLSSSFAVARDDNGAIPVEGGVLVLTAAPMQRQGHVLLDSTTTSASDPPVRRSKRRRHEPSTTTTTTTATTAMSTDQPHVQLAAAFTTPCMGVGYLQQHQSDPQVQILRHPAPRHPTNELVVHVSNLSP